MMHKGRFISLLMVLLIPAVLWAQSAAGESRHPYGLILYAQGSDLSIYRNGTLTDYDLSTSDVIGLPLFTGDLVQTGPGTFVEIQLQPSTTQLKIAENTTFRIQGLGGEGRGQIDLTYGRIRAKVESFAANVARDGSFPFSIRGQSAVAGVRGTDFGYDFIAGTDGETIPLTRVYCFEGSVEVTGTAGSGAAGGETGTGAETGSGATATGPGGQPAPAQVGPSSGSSTSFTDITGSVLIKANEMVTIAPPAPPAPPPAETGGTSTERTPQAKPPAPVIRTDPVAASVAQFWKSYDFQSRPISQDAAESRFPKLDQELDQHFGETVATAGQQDESPESDQASGEPQAASGQSGAGAQGGGSVTELPNESAPAPNPRLLPHETVSKTSQNLSMGIAIGGVTIGLAGAGLYYFGTDIFPGLSSETNGQLANGLIIAGTTLFGGGIIAYLVSLAANR
ncbi:FecR domain-containing protein [Salinispira pacifica]